MKTDKSEAKKAEDVYAHRRDPGEWSDEAERITVRRARTSVVSVRLPVEEYAALEQAAHDAGETLSEFVRKAVLLRRGVCTPPPSINVIATASNVLVEPVSPGSTTRSDATVLPSHARTWLPTPK